MSRKQATIIGLDLGSTTAKLAEVFFSGDREDFKLRLLESRILPAASWQELLQEARETRHSIIATGYFRKKVTFAALCPTELTTAREAATFFVPGADVVLDIGGQDIKFLDLRSNDFRLNDKCSAGTGAFFDFVASYFHIPVTDFSTLHFKAERHPELNSTCTVFALSEIISRLVDGYTREEVVRGLNNSFGEKIARLVPPCEKLALVGGVARNLGVVRVLEEKTGAQVVVPENCQLMNALGAAIFGWKKL